MLSLELPSAERPAFSPPPDVAPPATGGRLASPGPARVRAALMVLTIMLMVSSLGVINSAPARAWLPAAIPVAKAVGAAGASWVLGEAVEEVMADDKDGGKKSGKWGSKLKGLPGLAAGLLGGMATLGDLFGFGGDGDGVAMPDDFKDDVFSDDPTAGDTSLDGSWVNFTITGVHWDRVYSTSPGIKALRFDTECHVVNATFASCPDTTTTGISIEYVCADGSSVFINFSVSTSTSFSGSAPCSGRGGILSGEIVKSPSGTGQGRRGVTNPQKYINPHVVDADGLAAVSVTAEGSCVGPDGVRQIVTKTVAGAEVMPLVSCPEGFLPEKVGWTRTTPNGTEDMGGIGIGTPESMPDCPPGACTHVITVDGEPCSAYRPECFDWMNTQPPERVKCEFGPYALGLEACGHLEHVHKSTHGVTWGVGPDGQPAWLPARPDGTPDPTRVGTIWAPEEDPNPNYRVPGPGPLVEFVVNNPDPGDGTNPNPNPGGGFPQSGPNPQPPGAPIKDPETGANCIAGMWSWNPVDWVFTPVKCALSWAFIPKNGPNHLNNARNAWIGTSAAAWFALPPMMIDQLPEGGAGCMGPPLHMPEMLGGKTYYPLNACADPMAKYATMSRSLVTLVVGFYGVFSIVNSVSTALTGYRLFERENADAAVAAGKGAKS